MKKRDLKPVSLSIFILIVSLVSISLASSIEMSADQTNFVDSLSHQAIGVKRSSDELVALELEQIQNPKRPYSLGFVSESFTPTQKIDARLTSKLQALQEGKTSSFSNYLATNDTYGFVMVLGKLTEEKLQNLSNYGVRLLGYHSGHSYKAKIPANVITQQKGTVDYLVVQNSPQRRWLLNYITAGEGYLNAQNLSSVVYVLEITNKTTSQITEEVSTFINATK